MAQPLADTRILVVEDDPDIAAVVTEALLDAGYLVFDARRIGDALEMLQTQTIGAAILDINIGDELVFPIASVLDERGIPYLFASGADGSIIPSQYAHRPHLRKPYRVRDAIALLVRVLSPSPAATLAGSPPSAA